MKLVELHSVSREYPNADRLLVNPSLYLGVQGQGTDTRIVDPATLGIKVTESFDEVVSKLGFVELPSSRPYMRIAVNPSHVNCVKIGPKSLTAPFDLRIVRTEVGHFAFESPMEQADEVIRLLSEAA